MIAVFVFFFSKSSVRNNAKYAFKYTFKNITTQTSVTVNNSPIQDYDRQDDHAPPTYEMTPGFKLFTVFNYCLLVECKRCLILTTYDLMDH